MRNNIIYICTKVKKYVGIKNFYIRKTTSYDVIKKHNRRIQKMELNSKFKDSSEVINIKKGKEVKMEKKQLSEKQRQLLIKLIIAAISFVSGMIGVNSDVVSKVIEFVNTLV